MQEGTDGDSEIALTRKSKKKSQGAWVFGDNERLREKFTAPLRGILLCGPGHRDEALLKAADGEKTLAHAG